MASPLSSKSDQYLTAGSSDECLNQLFAFYTAVLERDTWALQSERRTSRFKIFQLPS